MKEFCTSKTSGVPGPSQCVYFLKNDKNVSLSRENWYNLAKINVGVPRYFDKAIEVYRSKYEKSYVQKVEKRG